MGILGISLDDLELLSVRDVMRAWNWKQHYDSQLLTATLRNDWEIARLLAAYTIAPHSKKKITSLKSFFPLDWDEGAGPKIGSEEYIEQAKEIRRRILAKEQELAEKQAND